MSSGTLSFNCSTRVCISALSSLLSFSTSLSLYSLSVIASSEAACSSAPSVASVNRVFISWASDARDAASSTVFFILSLRPSYSSPTSLIASVCLSIAFFASSPAAAAAATIKPGAFAINAISAFIALASNLPCIIAALSPCSPLIAAVNFIVAKKAAVITARSFTPVYTSPIAPSLSDKPLLIFDNISARFPPKVAVVSLRAFTSSSISPVPVDKCPRRLLAADLIDCIDPENVVAASLAVVPVTPRLPWIVWIAVITSANGTSLTV